LRSYFNKKFVVICIKYDDDVSDASFFTSRDLRRDDDEPTCEFHQSACLVTDDVRASSAAQVCSRHSKTGDNFYCTVDAETRVLSVMLPASHSNTYQAEPSPISNVIQTEDRIEPSRDIDGTDNCFKDTSMNKAHYVKRVVEEIVETERTYVRDLGHIIQVNNVLQTF